MLLAMLGTMLGGHSALRDLAAIGVLVATSVAYAPGARVDVAFREHLVDLWVMALVLVACLPGHIGHAGTPAAAGAGVHQHFSLPGGPVLVVIVLAAWVVARLLLARRGGDGRLLLVGRRGAGGGGGRPAGIRPSVIRSSGWSRASLVSGGIVAASLALMLAFCVAA